MSIRSLTSRPLSDTLFRYLIKAWSGQNLNDMENSLQAIKSRHRIRTWIETSTDVISYLGYVALGLVTLYGLHETGFFSLLRRIKIKTYLPDYLALI